jgi:hypothetical protein
MTIQDQLPIAHVFKLSEVQEAMALEVLRLNGIENPRAFANENSVRHVATFRLDAGVVAVTVISSAPIVKDADPSVAFPLVSK